MSSSSPSLTLRQLACWLQVILLAWGMGSMVQPVSASQVLPRLETETVTDPEQGTTVTAYAYDAANNRASKTVQGGSEPGFWQYDYNAANQLVIWRKLAGPWGTLLKQATLGYDANGNRSEQTVTDVATSTAAVTQYSWDAQDRLSAVEMPDGQVHGYEYDYRTRRTGISRAGGAQGGPGMATAVVFSGGLSLAEWESTATTDPSSLIPDPSSPIVHYTRGPDMGGGVGGLLYSRRGETLKYNLSNGRGDIVAQSDAAGALTWTASYEAYGKRTKETGENADKQRANTKDEDPTGLLNEGFRYRDLETGVWLSRDPAGFVDGPNLYAYVMQNPWTHWDPEGLRIPENQKEAKASAAGIEKMQRRMNSLVEKRDGLVAREEKRGRTAGGAKRIRNLTTDIEATAKALHEDVEDLETYMRGLDDPTLPIEHWNMNEAQYGHRVYAEPGIRDTTFDLLEIYGGAGLVRGVMSAATNALGKFAARSAAKGTGTVWDFVKATQPLYEGTAIPRSFELATGNGKVWVHGNATEHMAEYATSMLNRGVSPSMVNIGTQAQMTSLQSAVNAATANGVQYGKLLNVGGWELKFGAPQQAGQLPALIHALPR